MALPPRDRLGLPSEGLHHVIPNLTSMGGQVLCRLAPPFPPHRGHGLCLVRTQASWWQGSHFPRGLLRQPGQECAHADTLTVLWTQGHSTMSGRGAGSEMRCGFSKYEGRTLGSARSRCNQIQHAAPWRAAGGTQTAKRMGCEPAHQTRSPPPGVSRINSLGGLCPVLAV